MIPVRNVYYMLSYAFSVLRGQGYRRVATEEFDNVAELCAAILIAGVATEVRRGLRRDYVDRTEALPTLRGKVEVSESLRTQALVSQRVVCSFDELSLDTSMNRIIKGTAELLMRSGISRERRRRLGELLTHFAEVEPADVRHVDWNMRFDRNSQTYRMLMGVCQLVAKGLLQTTSDGSTRLMDFLDEQSMCRLYERFILEYYRRCHPGLGARASLIGWALDDDRSDMLPTMRSDITLASDDRVLIIDAKYYAHATQSHFDSRTVHSANLYQIFTYVKNKAADPANAGREVSGLLLYARTDEDVQPNVTYRMSGNRIGAMTLDLNQPFEGICASLDGIVADHFPEGAVG